MIGIEDFVAVHDGDEVFGVGEVDDVVGVAGEHDHGLDFVAGYFIFNDFIRAFLAHLNNAMALDDDELFPLAVVPVLPFGDTGLGNVDAHLAAVRRVD